MTAPGDVVGQAVVNVRTCADLYRMGKAMTPACQFRIPATPSFRCAGCQGDGTWLDTSNPTPHPDPADNYPGPCLAVDGYNLDGRTSRIPCHKPDGHDGDHGNDRYTWPRRPVENGDTDEES